MSNRHLQILAVVAAAAISCDGRIKTTNSGGGPDDGTDLGGQTKPPDDTPLGAIDGAEIYATICAACHQPIGRSTILGKKAADITRAMGTVAQMVSNPAVQNLTPAQIDAVADYLNKDGTQEPVPVGEGISAQAPLGNRFFLASKMKALFSRGNATLDRMIDGYITQLGRVHGGVCNRTMPNCQGPEDESIAAQGTPTANILRTGYRIKACEGVLENDAAVTNSLSLVSLTPTSPLSATNLDKVSELLISVPLSPGLEAKFAQLDATLSGETTLERWRLALVTLCTSSLFEAF